MKDEDKTKEQLVSEIKEMRRQIYESSRSESGRIADIIDFLPDATFAIDLSRKVIAWNKAIEDITGVKAEDILGKADHEYTVAFYGTRRLMLVDLIFGSDEETEKKYDFIKKEGDVLLAETDLIIDGIRRVVWVKAGPLYDKNGNIMGAIESVRDITDRRQMEKALQEAHDELEVKVRERTAELKETNKTLEKEIAEHKRSEELLRESMLFNKEIIDSASEGIIVYDRFFNYLVWNSFMEKITGKSADEVLGKNAFSLFPHLLEQGIDIFMQRALSGEIVITPDIRFYFPEKEISGWVSNQYGPHRNEKGEIIGIIGI
ncbi:MAG: PAS domain S-box protein, partial [Smithella sp.]